MMTLFSASSKSVRIKSKLVPERLLPSKSALNENVDKLSGLINVEDAS